MAFSPGRTVRLVVDVTAAHSIPLDSDMPQVMVTNIGPGLAFVAFGTGSVTATTDDFPILAGKAVLLGKGVGANRASACCAGERAVLFLTVGTGG